MRILAVLGACAGLLTLPDVALAQGRYTQIEGESCGGYPRINIETIPGMCAGLVFRSPGGRGNIRLPRTLLRLPGTDDWLVSDLGGWNVTAGGVWRLTAKPGEPAKVTRILGGLEMPHTLALGPDGRVYVGEMGRIFSFDPAVKDAKASIVDVITGLPDNRLHDNRHPLSAFVFDRDGALIVNIGARTDQCLDAKGARPGPTCAEGEGENAAAVLRRYTQDAAGKWSATVLASGLRNSMAFAMTPQGTLLQAENSIDIPDEDEPFDEINLIGQGKHYGWPYCMDKAKPTPGWAGSGAMDCAGTTHTAPVAPLPPHSAPLDMLYYTGAMFPELKGRLLVSLHGYKPTGGRIVSFATGADGLPVGAAQDVTTGWDARPRIRPQGSPVGIAVAPDGSIWVADDRSRAIIRFARAGS